MQAALQSVYNIFVVGEPRTWYGDRPSIDCGTGGARGVERRVASGRVAWPEKGLPMTLVVVGATLLLGLAIGLCGGTILVYLKAAGTQASRVEEIRRLRQEGLAVRHEAAHGVR